MNSRFGGMVPAHAKTQRDRLLYVGGGTLTFALLVIGILLLYSHKPVEAVQQVKAQQQNISDVAFGTVVLIAPSAPVPKGAKLSQVPLREMHWPRNEVPEGAVRDIDSIRDMYAKVGLPANQPVLRANLSAAPLVNGVAELIPPGHRAITIEVDSEAGVEGWATPGAHVDVLLTYRDPEDNLNKTRVAVEDAVVLSYNGRTQKAQDQADVAKVAATSTVTLAVTAEDSLKMPTARAMGRISLVLRNTNDPKSIGNGTFAANEWDDSAKKDGPAFVSKAFARFTTEDGKERHFELGPDQKWWTASAGDE